MFHVKHYPRETYCTLQDNQIKGNARPKIDIRLLVYVRVYQLQCLYYLGYNIIIAHILQNVNVSRETLKRYYIKYHVLTFQIFK
jgi:hypothetical protein|nr:MAG TPA: hypothetical protein [Caudoviricetes sp.]